MDNAPSLKLLLPCHDLDEIMIDVSIRLRHAILQGDLLLAKRILKNHPKSLYNPDIVGNTSLHIAAEKGHLGIVQHLVEEEQHERDGVSKNNNGDTPLMLAAGEGHEEVVHCIVSRFSRCIDWRNKLGVTAMMHAAKNGCDAVVNMLLDLGAEADVVDVLGNTSLHYASAYGHLKVIRSLVERGSNCEKPNRQGFTPLEYSYSQQAEQYFVNLIQERDKRWASDNARSRAATPIFGRSEKTTPQRQRASSGS
ncbi:Vacuolar protein sorting-associated protein 74 [Maublancomyces gigas]|uniref:Vacuolar protein sorting-associated protein 74 n=1 Tax=Discina gigas TaxID=1032678 RepID=A0ABR3GPF2_9PEZI